jgi:hypothetical protein
VRVSLITVTHLGEGMKRIFLLAGLAIGLVAGQPSFGATPQPDPVAQVVQLEEMKSQNPPPAAPVATSPVAEPKAGVYGYSSVQCDTGPVTRVFARATWRITSCDNGGLLAATDSEQPAIIMVMVNGNKVAPTAMDGGDPVEVSAAVAAFQAMTSVQVGEIVAETKAVKQ